MKEEIIEKLVKVKVKVKVTLIDLSREETLWKIRYKHKFKYSVYVGNFVLREICNETKPNLTEINN